MPRPKKEINPIRGERLKQILNEKKITQKELSETIHISQQAISAMITGKANVTESTAKLIIELYPDYRYEWLMGYDDFQSDLHKKLYPPTVRIMRKIRVKKAVTAFFSAFGLSFELSTDGMPDISTEEFTKLPENDMKDLFKDTCFLLESDTAYEFRTEKGEVLFRCSDDERTRFIQDICDFAEFKMNQMIDREREKNN